MQMWARILVLLLGVSAWAADWNTAVNAFKKGDYSGALRAFQAVAQEKPNYAGAHFYIGACQEKLGRADEAEASYRKAHELEPKNPTFALALSRVLLDRGKAQEAVRALEGVPTAGFEGEQKVVFSTALARAKLAANDVNGALEAAEAATQAGATSSEAWLVLGAAQSRSGRDSDAFSSYRRAFELSGDPKVGKTAAVAGLRAARLSQKENANTLYAQAAAIAIKAYEKKPSPEMALLASEALLGANRFDECLRWIEKVGSQNALTTYYRAQCTQGTGDVARAERLLREALARDPDPHLRRLIYSSLGYVLDKQKRYPEAEQAYREAGNQARAAEMRDKQAKYQQNLKADEEARRIEELKRTQEELRRLRGGAAPTPTPKP